MTINREELTKLAGIVGAALLLAGYVRHSIQNLWGTFNLTLLIAGAVLLLISLIFNYRAVLAIFTGRTGRLGTNTTVLILAVVAILAIINYLGYRYHKRVDVTAEQLYTLSDQTRKVVAGLTKEVKVIKFAKSEDPALRDRMREFRDLSKQISYQFVDPQLNPEIAQAYKLQGPGDLVTIVSSGERQERLTATDEQALVNAIMKVTRDKLKTVCFIEGHDERSLAGSEGEGYATVERVLKSENYETKTITLARETQVPAECAVLVAAGPKKGLFPQEAAMIGKYLDEGGKAMLLVDPDTDPQLGDVLKAWNVTLGNDTVVDTSGAGRLIGIGPGAPIIVGYPDHPITKDMRRTATFFPLARSVKTSTGGAATDLLKTSDASWAETELKGGGEVQFDEGKDTKGPVNLGIAASKKVGEKEARLVVIGDSDFASNARVGMLGNGDLFFNSINWLAQDEDLISIRPKDTANRSVTLTEGNQKMIFWLTILLMPLAVIGTGAYVWWKRR